MIFEIVFILFIPLFLGVSFIQIIRLIGQFIADSFGWVKQVTE